MKKTLKHTILILLIAILLTAKPLSTLAAEPTTLEALLEVLTEQKKEAQYNTKLNAPFTKEQRGIKETINPETGTLTVENTLLAIPGRKGHDLELKIKYTNTTAKLYEETTKSSNITNSYGATIIAYYNIYNQQNLWLKTGAMKYTTTDPTIQAQLTIDDETWIFNGYLKYETGTDLITSANITNYPGEKTLTNATKNILGEGWVLDLPTLDIENETIYLTINNQQTYQADLTTNTGIKNYPLTDTKFTKDQTQSNGIETSAYKLYQKDGTSHYFNQEGQLIKKSDRYNNSILYYWENKDNKKLLTKIEDTLGRQVQLDYQPNATTISYGETKAILVKTPIEGYENKYALTTYIDPIGTTTNYSYTIEKATFDLLGKDPAENTYINLTEITYPTQSKTQYSYYNEPDGYPLYKDDQLTGTYNYTTQVVDQNQKTTKYIYNSSHQLYKKQIQAEGKTIKETNTTYNPQNQMPETIATTTYSQEGTEQTSYDIYKYDSLGNLTEENHPITKDQITTDHYKTSYSYDNTYSQLVKIKYKKDQQTTIEETYNLTEDKKQISEKTIISNNNILAQEKYSYDNNNNLIKKTAKQQPNKWVTTTYTYSQQYKNSYITAITYNDVEDQEGNKTTIALKYSYYYDTGRLTSQTDGNNNTTKYQYDPLGRQTQITKPDNTTIKTNYNDKTNTITVTDENNNQLIYQYDPLGNLTKITEPYTNTSLVQYSYNRDQTIATKTDGNNTTTNYSYDNQQRLIEITEKDTNQNQLTKTKIQYKTNYKDPTGTIYNKITITKENQPKDTITHYYYNNKNQLIKQQAENNNTQYTATYTYDYQGNLLSKTNYDNTQKNYTYDPLGRLTKETNEENQSTTYSYDYQGNQTSITDPLGNTTTKTYDMLGRLTKETTPLEQTKTATTKIYYDKGNNKVKIIDPQGHITYQYYTSTNLLKTVKKPITEQKAQLVEIKYNKAGNITSIKKGQQIGITKQCTQETYKYDSLNRLIETTDNQNNKTKYQYDPVGNLTKQTDKNNTTITYTYDGKNRLIQKQNTKDQEKSTISLYYDALGNLTKTIDQQGITTYSYDQLGRLTKEQYQTGITKTNSYDKGNNLIAQEITKGSQPITKTQYKYNNLGQLIQLLEGDNKYTLTYDQKGRKTQETNQQGNITTTYTYYPGDHIKSLQQKTKDETKTTTYSYDKLKNLTKQETQGKTISYYYDPLNRLTTTLYQPENTIEQYSYDYQGNINQKTNITNNQITQSTYTYNQQNQLTQATTTTSKDQTTSLYSYDKNGNQTKKYQTYKTNNTPQGSKTTTYSYDGYNQLQSVTTNNNKTTSYSYNHQGIRTTKTTDQNTINYYYHQGNIILETDQNQQPLAKNIYTHQLQTRKTKIETYHYQTNHHGDIIAITDNQGTKLKSYQYDSYGNQQQKDPTTHNQSYEKWQQETSHLDNPFTYIGQYYDEESDLYYLRARYYDPTIQRFITEDSYKGDIRESLSLNQYTYCENNPIKYVDKTGHWVDTALDAASIVYDIKQLKKDPYSITNHASLIADGVCTIIPVVSGGGTVVRVVDNLADDAISGIGRLVDKVVDAIKGGVNASEEMTTLYRAVGPKEFYNVMETGKFSVIPQGLQAKQFGLNLEQTIKFAEKYPDLAAVIEVKVPKSVAYKLGDLTHVDRFIFKDGTLTIHVDDLEEFNKAIQSLSHKY